MKKIIVLVVGFMMMASYSQTPKHDKNINNHVAFFEKTHTSAKDYILELFEKNDLVILCERDHRENTQYQLFNEIIGDSRFIDNVGNVFFETGMTNLNPALNDFVHSENLSERTLNKKLLEFQRNSSFYPLWGYFNFYDQNRSIYTINQSLKNTEKINIYPVDVPLQLDSLPLQLDSLNVNYYSSVWDNILNNRDSLMAQHIIDAFDKIKRSNAKRKKALIIMNYRHAFNSHFKLTNGNIVKNVGGYLFEEYPEKIANVLINQLAIIDGRSDNDITFGSTQDGKWDAAFKIANQQNYGFNFKNSPFGIDQFDLWPFPEPEYTYQDIFTGLVYYNNPEDFKLITGVEGLVDSSFIETYKKRVLIWKEIAGDRLDYPLEDKLIYKKYNTRKEFSIDRLDSISAQINKWIIN